MQRTLYIIATTSRSGSTHLCRLLASTGRLGAPGEFFNAACGMRSAEFDVAYFQKVLMHASTANGVCGMKLSTAAFELWRARLGPIFDLLRPKYIWLRRRDAWRQAISLYRAEATGAWHWPAGEPRPGASAPFDAARIAACRRQIQQANEHWACWFAEAQIEPLQLWYEDFTIAPRETVQAVCRHVGVDARGMPPPASDLQVLRDEATEAWLARLHKWEKGVRSAECGVLSTKE